MITDKQRQYVKIVEKTCSSESEIVEVLKGNDDELRYYLKKRHYGWSETIKLINSTKKSADFYFSCGSKSLDFDAVISLLPVPDCTVYKYRSKFNHFIWIEICARGVSQWLLEHCKKIFKKYGHLVKFDKPLTEGFMRENKDWIDWNDISRFQKMGLSFMNEFKDKLNIRLMRENPYIGELTLDCFYQDLHSLRRIENAQETAKAK